MGHRVGITLCIVSSDGTIADLVRELISEHSDIDWELSNIRPGATVSAGDDLYIFDFSPDIALPQCAAWGRTHFVVLRRKEISLFCDLHPEVGAGILLKPLTRPVLRAILGQVIASRRSSRGDDVRALRLDRDELLQCLIHANLKLQEYDQERTNFLTRAIHDFRAPVSALTGYCGLLLEGQLGPLTSQQREVLERMLKSAKRLGRMSNAMFQLGVSGHIEQQPNFQWADIRECIEQALHEVAQFADEKHIEIFVDIPPPGGLLYFEPGQIEQVLVNLLDNACKFTPRHGWIAIKGYPYFWDRRIPNLNGTIDQERRFRRSQEPNAYRIDIQDSGPGIRPEHLDSMFEDYTSYAVRDDRSGAGLGLAICKMIITQHRGKVWAESRPEGALFSFVLPMQQEPAAECVSEADCRMGLRNA
ncbi:MAG TPA: ATP-binding protein [Candidatus Acidoferrum sp.]|jgi:signal transduction histidine kinase|nr:ATP-binding protein [Candidatus Acidoferrum sp.]